MVEATMPSFAELALPLRQDIDEALADAVGNSGEMPPRLNEALRYSLLGSGKRLRPIMVLLAAEACGCSRAKAMPAACAVEMIHAYSLVHDDLPAMDDDDLRRGRPTCHKVFGEALAILAGDALLTRAFELLAVEVQPPVVAASCCASLAEAAGAAGMVGGQVDDLEQEQVAPSGDIEQQLQVLISIHRRKTAAMLRVSLKLGGIVAGATLDQLEALDAFGRPLGLAFQIVDDLLDVGGVEAATGKRVGKDHGRGKLTFPGLLGSEESRVQAASLIDEACTALRPLGPQAAGLESLARYVLERDR
ncbi:MAG: polyprenyl synthetase family protein [Planctomycetes bacterium]|nr:polyprenyl synthetase family protein [Planctomycetota bacterium]